MCLWLPKGARIRSLLEDFLRKEMLKRGYEPVYSPHLGRVELYETSGHFPYYRDSQFPPLFVNDGGALIDGWIRRLDPKLFPDGLPVAHEQAFLQAAEVLGCEIKDYSLSATVSERVAALNAWQHLHERYLVKPMNCPHHAQIFKAMPRSYKQLPLRLFEFGTVYRSRNKSFIKSNSVTRWKNCSMSH